MRPKIVIPTVLVAIAVLVIAISMQKKQTATPAGHVVEATSPAAEPATNSVVESFVAKAPTNSNTVKFQITKITLK